MYLLLLLLPLLLLSLACRHNRPVPVLLVPLCQAVCMLHDVRRGAHYHQDNCHHLLRRLILVQDYLLALPLAELLQHGVLLAKLSVLVQDVYDVFNQFADRSARGPWGCVSVDPGVTQQTLAGNGGWAARRRPNIVWQKPAAAKQPMARADMLVGCWCGQHGCPGFKPRHAAHVCLSHAGAGA